LSLVLSERDMRGKVTKYLQELDAIAVENPAYPGTPDVNFIEGWFELKWLRDWPKGEDTVVKFSHYTPQQKVWMKRRHTKGGRVALLVQCKREWFMFKYPQLIDVGKLTKTEMFEQCHTYTNTMTKEVLIKWALN